MEKGAPAAIQVADRFHLVQNLAETLEKVFSSYGTELKAIEQQQRQNSVPTGTVVVTPRPTTTVELQAQKLVNYQHRVQQQQEIRNLSQQQWAQIAIAQAVGVSVRTVQRLLNAPDLPETASPNGSLGRSLLEPYKQSLLEWWNAQIRQPQVLTIPNSSLRSLHSTQPWRWQSSWQMSFYSYCGSNEQMILMIG
jgi:transposase